MFSHKNKSERTAAQAWDYLSSAMAAAGESAREAGRYTADVAGSTAAGLSDRASRTGSKLADKASRKASAARTEAWARANAAANALAGRKPGMPWLTIIGFGLIGVAIGWAAATTARAALERQAENEERELAETAVVVTPTTFDT
jgi:hypothetical protein